jgi:hypothetical protein
LIEIASLFMACIVWWLAPFGGGHTLISLVLNAVGMLVLGYVEWWVCRWVWKRLWLRSFRQWSKKRSTYL